MNRFWSKVDILGEDDCWNWLASSRGMGYGAFKYEGSVYDAHRFAWMLVHCGDVPDGMVIRHTCDNKACVNPKHLLSGTQKENVHDMWERGRAIMPQSPLTGLRGEDVPHSKLSNSDVAEIKSLYATGDHTYRSLADQFGVDHARSYKIMKEDKLHVC